MLTIVFIDVVITLGMTLIGFMLGFLLALAGLPEWLLWAMPAWFGCSMPAFRLFAGYGQAEPVTNSRRGRRPGQPQRPIASHPRRREPAFEDLYP
jgi:hypothetical protein